VSVRRELDWQNRTGRRGEDVALDREKGGRGLCARRSLPTPLEEPGIDHVGDPSLVAIGRTRNKTYTAAGLPSRHKNLSEYTGFRSHRTTITKEANDELSIIAKAIARTHAKAADFEASKQTLCQFFMAANRPILKEQLKEIVPTHRHAPK
jgi:hypothetical protein